MTNESDGSGGEFRQAERPRLAPVTFLPGVTPPAPTAPPQREAPRRAASLTDRPRRPVAFSEEYWADGDTSADAPGPLGTEGEPSDESEMDTDEPRMPIDEPQMGSETETHTEPAVLDRASIAASAAAGLTRGLGRRALSLAEARARLRADGLTDSEAAEVVEDFVQRGWLDDAVLAEQLVFSATTRKDMGTRAVRQLLVKRLVNREVIDAVIGELPDDDAERALEFARTKARAMTRFDDATATRRLMGMLARRGFGGSSAGQAARAALAEARGQSGASGVRFR